MTPWVEYGITLKSLTLAYALIINDYFPNQVSPGDQTRVASGPQVTLQKKVQL